MLLELKKYLMGVQSSTLEDLVNHFNVSESFMISLLEEWHKRGNVEMVECGCPNKCCGCGEKCKDKKSRVYRWVSCSVIVLMFVFSMVQNGYADDFSLKDYFELVLYADVSATYDHIKDREKDRHIIDKDFSIKEIDFGINTKFTDFLKFYSLLEYDHKNYFHSDYEWYFTDWHLELKDEEKMPVYLKIGYYELPFGSTDSNFIEDPITMSLTKTRDKAVSLGYLFADNSLDLSYTLFESTVEKQHNSTNFDDWLVNASYTFNENYSLGASYISNIASSLDLEDALVNRKKLHNLPGGFSLYGNIQPHDNFNLLYKYVTATEHFTVGDIYDDNDTKRRIPRALDFEAQVPFYEEYVLSFRYAFSHDGMDVFPAWIFGPNFSWQINDYFRFSLEYLRSKYTAGDTCTENLYQARVTFDL